MYFVQNMKYLTRTKIKQSDLARLLNISRQAVLLIVNSKDPKASTLIKLSEIFNVSIDDLLKKDLEVEQ